MSKYILFLNNEIKGYLNDEITTKKAVSALADKLIDDVNSGQDVPNRVPQRIFQEHEVNKDKGEGHVKIYSQTLGTFVNGYVSLQHTITWRKIEEYKADI
jgi:hypothetical protein